MQINRQRALNALGQGEWPQEALEKIHVETARNVILRCAVGATSI